MEKRRKKKCKICKETFYYYNSTQVVCGFKCSIEYANIITKKRAKEKAKQDKKKLSEAYNNLMSLQDWIKKLQTKFNTYIRLRDKDRGCISCGRTLIARKYDAGHFYPVTYSGLRFNEDNVHAQCVPCNRYKTGNLHEYRKRITNRITPEELKWLDENRHKELGLSIPEVKELIEIYTKKIKDERKRTN